MLNKSLALGILAAFAMAPAAFAGQVQGNETNTNINAGNVGNNNVIGITNNTKVGQGTKSHGRYWCSGSNSPQVQGNATNTFISAGNVGHGNVVGIKNKTKVTQRLVAAGCH
jgi:hypothetical protein